MYWPLLACSRFWTIYNDIHAIEPTCERSPHTTVQKWSDQPDTLFSHSFSLLNQASSTSVEVMAKPRPEEEKHKISATLPRGFIKALDAQVHGLLTKEDMQHHQSLGPVTNLVCERRFGMWCKSTQKNQLPRYIIISQRGQKEVHPAKTARSSKKGEATRG
ncbi:hypothetical protein ElyMa_005065000 [Elysia marginata]|uniref:Uncharacterized protein n=1 Tax=Elysia marginata TaxID=1093978 RepID=A0AAV4JEK2_9GAST|nr:hypothetical protein ElyMa_005065000 [Elysia marginata]